MAQWLRLLYALQDNKGRFSEPTCWGGRSGEAEHRQHRTHNQLPIILVPGI